MWYLWRERETWKWIVFACLLACLCVLFVCRLMWMIGWLRLLPMKWNEMMMMRIDYHHHHRCLWTERIVFFAIYVPNIFGKQGAIYPPPDWKLDSHHDDDEGGRFSLVSLLPIQPKTQTHTRKHLLCVGSMVLLMMNPAKSFSKENECIYNGKYIPSNHDIQQQQRIFPLWEWSR